MISYNFVGTIVVETRMKEKNLIIQLLRSNAFVEEKLNASLKPHGLSLPQFNVLRILRGRQGAPANLSNIQEQMIKPMSNTSRLVDKLIDKGWVSRDICKYNRRKVEIFITENGLNALQQLDNLVAHEERQIMGMLSEKKQKSLLKLLVKVTAC